MLRRAGVNQCPTTAAPITSVTNLYLCPSHANSTGHELPRRSASFIAITCVLRQIDLVLQHARGPQDAQQVDARRIAQPDKNLRRATASGSPTRRPAPTFASSPLANTSTFVPMRGLVVGKPGQIEPHKVVLVRAHVAQQHRRRAFLRHDQVGSAVAIHVRGNQPARRVQLAPLSSPSAWLTSSNVPSPRLRSTRTSGPAFGLHNCGQVDPAIVVDIDRRHAPSAQRVLQWQRNAFKSPADVFGACDIAPQREARRAGVRHRDIHPAVFVVVEHRDAGRRAAACSS